MTNIFQTRYPGTIISSKDASILCIVIHVFRTYLLIRCYRACAFVEHKAEKGLRLILLGMWDGMLHGNQHRKA